MERCKHCGEKSVVLDPAGGSLVCSSCGVEQSADNFQTQIFSSDGVFIGAVVQSVGSPGPRERQIYLAETEIGEVTSRIGLSAARSAEVRAMVSEVTQGKFGSGDWFAVLVAACACITMRKNRLPLSIAEAADSIGRHPHEVGRLMIRVCRFLNLHQLPEFDIFQHLERTLRNCPVFTRVEEEKAEEMLKQGRFLLQCAVKWFLSTGRQPLPLVAAVASFAAELNGVIANTEDIAGYIYARPATCKLRKKELLETLVQVAKALLPWGEDVTVKNIHHHAPLLLKCMERRSKDGSFDLDQFTSGIPAIMEDDSDCLSIVAGDDLRPTEDMKEVKISGELLSRAYDKALLAFKAVEPSGESERSLRRRKNRELTPDLYSTQNRLSPSDDLSFEQILERDVGYDPPPPSFVVGLEAQQRRKEKIAAAKRRIDRIKRRESAEDSGPDEYDLPGSCRKGKKRQRRGDGGLDWEGCIIELLLLHRVREEEIEQGHYNRLLDLYVFTPLDT